MNAPHYLFRSGLLAARLLLLVSALFATQKVSASSFGAPVCEIDAGTMSVNMSASVLSSPGGWSLQAPSSYSAGSPITISLAHTNAAQKFRGLLLWATTGGAGGLGSWIVPSRYRNPAACMWSLTHASPDAKEQQSFSFSPPAAGTGPLVFHAFLVEDCGGPSGSCRPNWVQLGDVVVGEAPSIDTVPDAFTFVAQASVAPVALVTSNAVTITGINAASPVTVTGGQYSTGCGASFGSAAGTINSGQTVCVRHTASSSFSSAVSTTLTIGGVSATFTSTTTAAPIAFTLTVSKSGTGSGTVTSSPTGIDCGATCSASFPVSTVLALTATPDAGSTFAGWGEACTGSGACAVTMDATKSVAATFNVSAPPGNLVPSPTSLSFGGQSMGTTAPAQVVTFTNAVSSAVSVSSIAASTYFAVTHDCVTLAAGASCSATVTFKPTAEGGLTGMLTVVSSTGTQTVALSGTGEKSLVTHYYRSILRRAPDAGGKTFWNAEAARVQALGVNVNEVWFAMAGSFYFSAEYLAFNRDNAGFVTDLYSTFFNRAPDAGGFADWTAQLAAGMPREVVGTSFMFSNEFAAFTQGIFGTQVTRKEVDTVVDFFRGLLARLPDDGGFNFWVKQFRTAQCQGGAAVIAQVESISSQFAQSAEYSARSRTNAQYVGDLYNAFLRRGGELAGVQFWINQIDTGARSRENVRQAFVASPEFQARVAAIIAQGCLTP